MVHNFLRGGAAINALSRVAVTDLVIVDVGVDGELPEHPSLLRRKVARGTRNMLEAPAMTRDEMNAALLVGAEVAHSPFIRHEPGSRG
jgi:nicotinate-nucleotide--dimethylbenzimidazole phosphoribosyltransferase